MVTNNVGLQLRNLSNSMQLEEVADGISTALVGIMIEEHYVGFSYVDIQKFDLSYNDDEEFSSLKDTLLVPMDGTQIEGGRQFK